MSTEVCAAALISAIDSAGGHSCRIPKRRLYIDAHYLPIGSSEMIIDGDCDRMKCSEARSIMEILAPPPSGQPANSVLVNSNHFAL